MNKGFLIFLTLLWKRYSLAILATPFVILSLFLINKNILIFGKARYTQDFSRPDKDGISMFHTAPAPEKNMLTRRTGQRLTETQSSFTFQVPHRAKTLSMSFGFDPIAFSKMEVGVPFKSDQESRAMTKFFTLDFPLVDQILESPSNRIFAQEGNIVYLERDASARNVEKKQGEKANIQPRVQSANAFWEDLPDEPVGVLNAWDDQWDLIPDIQEADVLLSYLEVLRGSHTIIFYLSDGRDVFFKFNFVDQNLAKGKDPIFLRLNAATGKEIQTVHIDDDRKDQKGGQEILESSVIEAKGLKGGRYVLTIDTTSDMFMNGFQTSHSLFYFDRRLVLADPAQSSQIYVRSDEIAVSTQHEEGIQIIKIDDKDMMIGQKAERYVRTFDDLQLHVLDVSKNDIAIEGKMISLQPNIQPFIHVTRLSADDDWRKYPFLVVGKTWDANVSKSSRETRATLPFFNTNDLDIKNQELKMVIRVQGLSESRNNVTMRSVGFDVRR